MLLHATCRNEKIPSTEVDGIFANRLCLDQAESSRRAVLGDRAQTAGTDLHDHKASKLRYEDLLLLDVGTLSHLALVVCVRNDVAHQTVLAGNNALVAHEVYSRLKTEARNYIHIHML